MSGGAPTSRPDRAAALLAAAVLLAAAPARAEPIHGRLAVQDSESFASSDSADAVAAGRERNDVTADARLIWEPSWDRWALSLHYEAGLTYGDSAPAVRAAGAQPTPPSTLADLTDVFADRGRAFGVQRIDRLAVTYSTPDAVVRV